MSNKMIIARQGFGQSNINTTSKNKYCKTFITSFESNNTRVKNPTRQHGVNRRTISLNVHFTTNDSIKKRLRFSKSGVILTGKRRSLHNDNLKLKSMDSSNSEVS